MVLLGDNVLEQVGNTDTVCGDRPALSLLKFSVNSSCHSAARCYYAAGCNSPAKTLAASPPNQVQPPRTKPQTGKMEGDRGHSREILLL